MNYIGILDGSSDTWGVRFPDLPGCVGAGDSPDAAIADAGQALRDVIDHKARGGHPIPAPATLETILASGEIAPGETIVIIPLLLDAGRTVRANLTVDAGLLDAVDQAAKARGITRSAFFASAAREKLLTP